MQGTDLSNSLVLGIESSCDETAVALVRGGREVVHSLIASQVTIHAQYGGVVPEIAAREHLRVLHPLYKQLMVESGTSADQIDAIAVTQGPGLVGALLVGASFAKGLALSMNKPLITVDHVHSHIHGALLGVSETNGTAKAADLYPLIALVVSGGHTNLYFMRSPVEYELLAHTMDDACGECFDKVAKILGLAYPGGPHIERLARAGRIGKIDMPRMVERKAQMAFSYSGLKTHMVQLLQRTAKPLSEEFIADACASFQEEALGQIVRKLESAVIMRPEAKTVLVAGGVAANQRFKELCAKSLRLPVVFPPLQYCSDNAAMVAACGWHHMKDKPVSGGIHDWDVFSRYRFEEFKV